MSTHSGAIHTKYSWFVVYAGINRYDVSDIYRGHGNLTRGVNYVRFMRYDSDTLWLKVVQIVSLFRFANGKSADRKAGFYGRDAVLNDAALITHHRVFKIVLLYRPFYKAVSHATWDMNLPTYVCIVDPISRAYMYQKLCTIAKTLTLGIAEAPHKLLYLVCKCSG